MTKTKDINSFMNQFHFEKFTKDQRSSFKYWYYHWKAFNLVAIFFHAWKPKYISNIYAFWSFCSRFV